MRSRYRECGIGGCRFLVRPRCFRHGRVPVTTVLMSVRCVWKNGSIIALNGSTPSFRFQPQQPDRAVGSSYDSVSPELGSVGGFPIVARITGASLASKAWATFSCRFFPGVIATI